MIGQTAFISGSKVGELEERLAEFCGVRNCVTCGSGTDALLLPLMAWGIEKGDAVFVPDFTFFATAEVVARLGATPVFVDIEPDSFNMRAGALEQAIERVKVQGKLTPKAIIPVDLFGQPAKYPALEQIAKAHGLYLLEDAAQGFGGAIGEKRACSFGDAAATSFFPAKSLGCYGDGGAVFTNDDALAQFIRSAAVHGRGTDKYDNVRVGMNSRLDTIQAAILLPKFAALRDYELAQINAAARQYNKLLGGAVQTPKIHTGYFSSYAQYSILLQDSQQRSFVMDALRVAGIPSNIYYRKPLHSQPVFAGLENSAADFPVSLDVCDRILSLPIHPYLDKTTIAYVADTITKAIG